MRIFVFSDSHLSTKYDKEFYEWVKYWSSKADKIIICGDFWESDLCSFDEFVKSEWKDTLFPLLKSKDTHYIYGNHDYDTDSDDRVSIFSNEQSYELDLALGDREYHIEHGDRLCNPFDLRFLRHYGLLIQQIGCRLFGKSFLWIFKKHIKDIRRNWDGEDRFLICGHTHYQAKGKNFFVMYPSTFGMLNGVLIEDDKVFEINKYEREDINSK